MKLKLFQYLLTEDGQVMKLKLVTCVKQFLKLYLMYPKRRQISEHLDRKSEADTGQVEWTNAELETLQRPLQAGVF